MGCCVKLNLQWLLIYNHQHEMMVDQKCWSLVTACKTRHGENLCQKERKKAGAAQVAWYSMAYFTKWNAVGFFFHWHLCTNADNTPILVFKPTWNGVSCGLCVLSVRMFGTILEEKKMFNYRMSKLKKHPPRISPFRSAAIRSVALMTLTCRKPTSLMFFSEFRNAYGVQRHTGSFSF